MRKFVFIAVLLAATSAIAQLVRTFVSISGLDTNSCGLTALYLFNRTTGQVREIYSFGFDVSAIAITKDDRTIYFLRTSDEADIWLAELK
ncbi:MAG TPA: hypothetical protein VIF83_06265 [Gemmatimonadaceae bacterium]|jgi:hypothetical protein